MPQPRSIPLQGTEVCDSQDLEIGSSIIIDINGFSTIFTILCALLLHTGNRARSAEPAQQVLCDSHADLRCARDQMDVPALRAHAWNTLTKITRPVSAGRVEWETWSTKRAIFEAPSTTPLTKLWSREDLSPPLKFRPPPPFFLKDEPGPSDELREPRTSVDAVTHLLTEVRLNPAAMAHIRDALGSPLEAWMKDRRAQGSHSIPEFPHDAIILKAVWWPVEGDDNTVLPVWDGIPTRGINEGFSLSSDGYGNDFTRWERFVAIQPTGFAFHHPPTVRRRIPLWRYAGSPPGDLRELPAVSIERFHSRTLTHEDVADDPYSDADERLEFLFHFALRRSPRINDKLVLVGFHVTTKELPDWVWMTFWWHDAPDLGEFAADRPSHMPQPWRNYLMDIAVSADCPPDHQGRPKAIFNPWLEAGFSNGLTSNCLGCHQRAVLSENTAKDGRAGQEVYTNKLPLSDEYYNNRMSLDYLWSLNPIHKVSPATGTFQPQP